MNTYNILLVDDEAEVRNAIIQKIDWEALGYGQVHAAENGLDALEKVEQYQPDVLLTDIRMPYMDGLQLCERLRKKYPLMKLLIFSGFDDFEYAKQAISLRVTEYILKPVNVEELSEVLSRVKELLDEEARDRRDANRLRASFEDSIPVLQEAFMNRLLKGHIAEDEIRACMEHYRIDLLDAWKWEVAAVLPLDPVEDEVQWEREMISIRAFLQESLKDTYRYQLFRTPRELCLIVAVDEEDTKMILLDFLGELCMQSSRMLNLKIAMGTGHSTDSITGLTECYRSAVEALQYAREHHRDTPVYINDILWDQENASAKAVAEAKKYIQEHYKDPNLSADEICRELSVSPNYFSTIFKKETGTTYVAYLTAKRMEKAVDLLLHTSEKTYMIAEQIGYQDQNYFSYVFKKNFGVSPTAYRKQHEA